MYGVTNIPLAVEISQYDHTLDLFDINLKVYTKNCNKFKSILYYNT